MGTQDRAAEWRMGLPRKRKEGRNGGSGRRDGGGRAGRAAMSGSQGGIRPHVGKLRSAGDRDTAHNAGAGPDLAGRREVGPGPGLTQPGSAPLSAGPASLRASVTWKGCSPAQRAAGKPRNCVRSSQGPSTQARQMPLGFRPSLCCSSVSRELGSPSFAGFSLWEGAGDL